MLRAVLFLLAIQLALAGPALGDRDSLLQDLEERVAAALSIEDDEARLRAVRALFFRDGLDGWAEGLAERTAESVATMGGREVTFATLPGGADKLHVVNGYEYRPNLEPVGHLVLTDPAMPAGNDTRILYARDPNGQRYVLPLTVRRLVNPDAPPDKQLQMIVIGRAQPRASFEGWCDIALSDETMRRVTLGDQGAGNQTRILRGQFIESCEVTNTAGRGSLSLLLMESGEEIFAGKAEYPDNAIRFARSR